MSGASQARLRKSALLSALLAVGLALALLGDVGDAYSTYERWVAWAKQAWETGDHGLSNQELYFVVGILALAFFVLLIQRMVREPLSDNDRGVQQQQREILNEPDARRRYLKWLELDVANRLRKSLHDTVRLDLGMDEDTGATRPWHTRYVSQSQGTREFTNFAEALEAFHHRVLLLGAPGSGKTTTLLDAILRATQQALADDSAPIPVYFNLSSFSDPGRDQKKWWHRRPDDSENLSSLDEDHLEHQMIAEMARLPSTHRGLCGTWFRQGRVGLYLDGLDEVPEQYAKKLVQQINHGYCKRFTDRPLVVASRIIEYRTLQESREGALKLDGAATLQPLSPSQIQEYLEPFPGAQGLRAALKDDATLEQLASSPLTLSMMTLAYSGRLQTDIPTFASLPQQRRELFDTFVPRMMQRQARRSEGRTSELDRPDHLCTPYSTRQMNRYLGWFAVRLSERMRTLFSIRSLYPIIRTKNERGEWDLTVTTDAILLGLFSFVGALLFGLTSLSSFSFLATLALLIGLSFYGLSLGTYVDFKSNSKIGAVAEILAIISVLSLIVTGLAIVNLSFRSLAPVGWNGTLLALVSGLPIWAVSSVIFAYTVHSPKKDYPFPVSDPLWQFSNRRQRFRLLRLVLAEMSAGILGGVVGLTGWWLLASEISGFNWVSLGIMIGIAGATVLLVDEGILVVGRISGLVIVFWGLGWGLSGLAWFSDPLAPWAVVATVMGLLVGFLSDGIELAILLFLFALAGVLLFGSAGAIAGGLAIIPFAVWALKRDPRPDLSFFRERLASPCLILALVFSRNLPFRLQQFLRYAQTTLLVKRTGGELEFSHRILRDHFATRDLVHQLAISQGADKFRVVRSLGTQGEAALDVLVSLLDETDVRLREGAVRSICRIRAEDSLLYLQKILDSDPFPEARAAVLDAVGRLPKAEHFIPQASKDPSPLVRSAAIKSLPKSAKHRDSWSESLADPSRDVVRSTLGTVGRSYVYKDKHAVRTFFGPPPTLDTEDLLLSFASDRNVDVRLACAFLLSQFRSPATTEALSGLLQDDDEAVRLAATQSLGEQETRQAFNALRGALSARSRDLRIATALAIGKVAARLGHSPAGQELLLQLTADRNPEIREAAYERLPVILGSASAPHLVRGLKDRQIKVRLTCLRALGQFSGPGLPELIHAFRSRATSWAAAKALAARPDSIPIPIVMAALKSRRRWQRLSAVYLAAHLLREGAQPDLEAIRLREQKAWPRLVAWLESRIANSFPASEIQRRLERQSKLRESSEEALEKICSGQPIFPT